MNKTFNFNKVNHTSNSSSKIVILHKQKIQIKIQFSLHNKNTPLPDFLVITVDSSVHSKKLKFPVTKRAILKSTTSQSIHKHENPTKNER